MNNASRVIQLYRVLILVLLASMLPVAPVSAAPPAAPDLVPLDAVASRLATLPAGMAAMMADAVPETQVYLLGGCRSEAVQAGGLVKTLSRDIYRYDAPLDQLAAVDELPTGLALAAHVYVLTEGLIYLFGGIEEAGGGALAATTSVRTYRPATGEVTTLAATLPGARARASAVYVGELQKIFLIGGVGGLRSERRTDHAGRDL